MSYNQLIIIQIIEVRQDQMAEIIDQILSTNYNRQRKPNTNLPFGTQPLNNNFANHKSSFKTQIYTLLNCKCNHFQKKIRELQTKMKKLMTGDQKSTSQDSNIEAISSQTINQNRKFDSQDTEKLFIRVNLKEESQILTSLSQTIEEIIKKQKENKEVLNKIQAEQQKSIVLKRLKNQTQNHNGIALITSSRLKQTPNAKQNDTDIIEEIINLNATRISDESDMKSQKSDLSGSITSKRHSQISRMTEKQKEVEYSSQMRNTKMMAKLKKRK